MSKLLAAIAVLTLVACGASRAPVQAAPQKCTGVMQPGTSC